MAQNKNNLSKLRLKPFKIGCKPPKADIIKNISEILCFHSLKNYFIFLKKTIANIYFFFD